MEEQLRHGERRLDLPRLWAWREPTTPMEQFIRGSTKPISNRGKMIFVLSLVRISELARAWSQCSGQALGALRSPSHLCSGWDGSLGEHSAAVISGSCCLEPPLFNFYFSSILVAAWKSKIGGRDLMHAEIVQFNGGNNLSSSQY